MNLELTPSSLLTNLRSLLRPQYSNLTPLKKILVAYSGGLDSHVLLHLLSRIPRDVFDIRAVYINHGLQSQAVDWAKHCQKTCQTLKIPFACIDLNLDIPKGESLEEIARKGRYKALYEALQDDEVLMTAHHQSDQAETLLLQLFRGAGVQGLAAMPKAGEINFNGRSNLHLRPLLNQPRLALEAYVNEFDLEHIEDPSNKDTAFDRNFLRQEAMPLLRKRWLGLDKAISRTAVLQAEAKTLLDEFAEELLPAVLAPKSPYINYLRPKDNFHNQSLVLAPIVIPELLKLSESKQRLLLRYWISQQGFSAPSSKKLQHIFSDLINSAIEKQPLVEWKGAELRRFHQHMYIMSPLPNHDTSQVIPWETDKQLHISSLNITLEAEQFEPSSGNVTVRFRQGGETIEIAKRGNISLKNLFQEEKIPPWIRSRLPLIYIGDKLVKIVGLKGLKRDPPTF